MGYIRRVSDEKILAFLDELSEVSKKHGLFIEGCGCCGSPVIERLVSSTNGRCEQVAVDLGFNHETGRYEADEC